MKKTLAKLAVILLLSIGSCTLIPAAQPEPIVLPYLLYEDVHSGNQVTVTLQTMPDGPTPYGFHIAVQTAEGQTKFGVYVITVEVTEGYRQDMSVDWTERIGDQKGSGALWEGGAAGAEGAMLLTATVTLDGGSDNPVAVFVRIVAADPEVPDAAYEEIHGPVAVLRSLPDGQGVIRLDQ